MPGISDEDTELYPPLDPDAAIGARYSAAEDLQYPRRSAFAGIAPPPVIHTKEFRRWFGDWKAQDADHSVIVDETGRPDIVYHGTQLSTEEQIEELRSGDYGISRALGTHVAFDNRVTDAFTVGRDARKRPSDPVMYGDSQGKRAMARIKPGGRVLPLFANVRHPLDLASGFEPLGLSEEDVWSVPPHDDHLIRHAVTYLAIEADPSLIGRLGGPTRDREDIEQWADEKVREIQAGERDEEIPPGGKTALIARNYSASASTYDETRDAVLETFFRAYDYDGLIYVNTSGQEVTREEIDPLSLIVFNSEDLFSIYADSFRPGDPSLGLRGNPPMESPLSRVNPSDFTGAVPTTQSYAESTERTSTMPDSASQDSSTGGPSKTASGKAPSEVEKARENTERLQDRLERMVGRGGDGAPTGPAQGPSGGTSAGRDNPDEESDGSGDRRQNPPPEHYDEGDLLGVLSLFQDIKQGVLAKYETMVKEYGAKEAMDDLIADLNIVAQELIPRSADYINVDLESARETVGVELKIEPPEVEADRPVGPGDEDNFGFPEGSFDDRFYLSASNPEGRIAVEIPSVEDYLGGKVDNMDMEAIIDEGVADALRDGDLGFSFSRWEKVGGRWEVQVEHPIEVDITIQFRASFGSGSDVKAYRVSVDRRERPKAFAEFLYEVSRRMAPSIEEESIGDVQFRISDLANYLQSSSVAEIPEGYASPRTGVSAYRLARPNEPDAGPTITPKHDRVYPGPDEEPPSIPEEELDYAEKRARQTGVHTAIFVAHGVSGSGQPQEVSRIVVGERDLVTKDDQRLDPGTYSWIHSLNPQTVSEVGAQRSERRVQMGRGSRSEVLSEIMGITDKDKYRVAPYQELQDNGDLDTFYSWTPNDKPESAVDAKDAGDLGVPEGVLARETEGEDVKTFTISDIGGGEYDGLEEDIDLKGKEPLKMTDAERRDNNERAVSIITEKEPSQITVSDREVLRKYTGAGGLGMETGTGSIRGERTEHYTDYRIVSAMWEAMGNIGQEGNFLEPGAGIGNVAGLRPDDNDGFMVMVENSTTTADILEVLYPNQQTLHRNLASVDFGPYQLQGAIGNVPFANSQIHQSDDDVVEGLNGDPNIHDYFILRALNAIEPGGVVMLITSTTTADRQSTEFRQAMCLGAPTPGHPTSDHRAAFLGGLRLPSETFEASASTSVATDLLCFQKLPDGSSLEGLPGEVFDRTYQFMAEPERREGVIKPNREEGSQEAKNLVEKIGDLEAQISEQRKRKERIREQIRELEEEKKQYGYMSDEREKLGEETRELRQEKRELESRIKDDESRLETRKEQFDELEERRVNAHINQFFDQNPGAVLGELKFGYKRQSIYNFGVDGSVERAVEAIENFDPQLARSTAQEKELFREGTGQSLGIERKHPDGAVVHRDGKFYESRPVGYSRISVDEEIEDKAKSAVDILETYEALTYALAREAPEIEIVRQSLKAKLKSHERRFGLPGEDEDLMGDVFRYDPRRPTLNLLMDVNEVGNVEFADVIDFDEFYASDEYRAEISDNDNLEAIAQFIRAQGEEQTAETYARFYKGGQMSIEQMQEVLQESEDFYFVPSVGPHVVDQLSEQVYEQVAEQITIPEDSDRDSEVESAIAEAYKDGEGGYIHKLFFESGELYRRRDLIDLLIEEVETEEEESHLRSVKERINEELPEPKSYWDIELDPRHYRSWLPLKYIEMFINDQEYLGYDVELEWVDEAPEPEDRGLIIRYRNQGTYVGGITDQNFSEWDRENGWHGVPYSAILRKYLRFNAFPLKHGGQHYVEVLSEEAGGGIRILDGNDPYNYGEVTSKDDAREHPIQNLHVMNKELQAQNERQMREQIPTDFETWADNASDEVQSGIAEAYNRTYRSRKLPEFDGSTLNLPGFNFPKPIFEHNQRAAEKLVYNQGGGDNHSVGAGKTFASIIAMETLRSRGLVHKPLFVVPTQVIEKWMAEYQELFPEARLLVLRGRSEGLEEEVFRAQLFDYDAIFTTIPGFKGLQLSPETRRARIQDRIDLHAEKAQEIEEDLEKDYPKNIYGKFLGGSDDRFQGDGIIDTIEDFEDELQEISEEQAEEQVDTVYLDEIGIDAFCFDEAHAYKNALTPSALAAEIGIAKNDPSSRAEDAKTKVDWLHWKLGGDKNSFILTATPLENNPLEVWHMLNLCGPSVLERYGIESLDAFIDLYVEVKSRMEQSVDGQFSTSEVVTGFRNVREMRRVIDERLDIMSYQELINFYTDPQPEGLGLELREIPFGRPDKVVNEQILEPSDLHEALLEDIRMRSQIIRAALRDGTKITDNFLSLTTDGGTMAEDLRLYQPAYWGYEGSGLKVDNIAEQVADEYNQKGLPLDKHGDPIYPPSADLPGTLPVGRETSPVPRELRDEPQTTEEVRQSDPLQPRQNPRVITDRFGAPIGRVEDTGEERENPSDSTGRLLADNSHQAVRENPTQQRQEWIDDKSEGDEVKVEFTQRPDEEPETVTVEGFAPRNQIIFTSSSSFKSGPHNAESLPGELPEDVQYVENVEKYWEPNMELPVNLTFQTGSWLRFIKAKLVEAGIPKEDIAIVSGTIIGLEEGPDGEMRDRFITNDEDKNKAKTEVQEKYQNGEYRVLIGTNAISEGMNLDRYTTAMYHMDIPWKPSRVEQRNGRGLRQGNIYDQIEINFLLLNKSFDNYRLKLVNQKQNWIDDVLYGKLEEDQTKVRTDAQDGNSQSIDYEDMMIATSESDVVERFFRLSHEVSTLEPDLDRKKGELNTSQRKLRAAKDLLEEQKVKKEDRTDIYETVVNTDLPDEEELEEGTHYEVSVEYYDGKDFNANIEMKLIGDGRGFEFRAGGRYAANRVGEKGAKKMLGDVTNGSPTVKIKYSWSKKAGRHSNLQMERSPRTYLKRALKRRNLVDQEDWIDYYEEDVKRVLKTRYRREVREQKRDEAFSNVDEEDMKAAEDPSSLVEVEVSDDEIPDVPDPITVTAIYDQFKPGNKGEEVLPKMTYNEVKQMLGMIPGGRYGKDEAWGTWEPIIEEHLPKAFLAHARTYKVKAEGMIEEFAEKVANTRERIDRLEEKIENYRQEIEEGQERLVKAQEKMDDLRPQVNAEMQSQFENREMLYEHINRIRGEFDIQYEIPMRLVGVPTGSDTEKDEEEEEDDAIIDARLSDFMDGEGGADIASGSGGGSGGSSDSGGGSDPGSGGSDSGEGRESLPGYQVPDSVSGGSDEGGSGGGGSEGGSTGEDELEITEDEAAFTLDRVGARGDGPFVVRTSQDYVMWGLFKGDRPAGFDVNASRVVRGEDLPDLERLFGRSRIRRQVAHGGGYIASDMGSDFAMNVMAPVAESSNGTIKYLVAYGENVGAFMNTYISVGSPLGESAYEKWVMNFNERQNAIREPTSEKSVEAERQTLRARYEDFEPRETPSDLYPSDPSIGLEYGPLLIPPNTRIRSEHGAIYQEEGTGGVRDDMPHDPRLGQMSSYITLFPSGQAYTLENMHVIYADHWQFVMEALTGSSVQGSSTFEPNDIELKATVPEERRLMPGAVYFTAGSRVLASLVCTRIGSDTENSAGLSGQIDESYFSEIFRPNPGGDGAATDAGLSTAAGEGGQRGFPSTPIGVGVARPNPSSPTSVAEVDTDNALSYLAKTDPGSFKVKTEGKQIRANDGEVHHLFTDPGGSLLLVVPDSRVEPAEVPEGTAPGAEAMHEEFTHYEADGESMVLDLPDSSPDSADPVGYADEVIYQSDKVMRPGDQPGKVHDYVHEFDEGQRPVYMWGDVAIVDRIEVDGRGILN